MHLGALLGFVITLWLAGSADLQAQTYQHPKAGRPALALELPAGWTAAYDADDNLQFSNSNSSLNLQLNMIDGDALAGMSLDSVGRIICEAADIPPYTRKAPGAIDGRPGETFFTTKTYPNGGVVRFAITLVRLDDTHIASLGAVSVASLTTLQVEPLEVAISKVRLIP